MEQVSVRQHHPKSYSMVTTHITICSTSPDGEYRVPKATVKCLATTHAAYVESARAAAETGMLAKALQDVLEVPLYQAALAGYSWSVDAASQGLEMSLSGYSGDALQTLASKIAAAVAAPPALPVGRFEALRALEVRETA
eukprot:CAMPEP_0169271664 /NCGR_PEP_ID=MMETSP1016-20121227/49919_1 /TAXON_ID=342587 /ORGANISM="Karlodinium micrum, Strain CCMP2283" /LENGTH=139 /DNA_ID=CAMNT_0009357387 /DNA_START=196 /DNA_END=611 /DNA_ORIENTATION=-